MARRRWGAVVAVGVVALAAAGCISSATVQSGVLTVVGSEYGDTITLRLKAGDPTTLEVDDSADPAVEHSFDRATFTSIVVEGGDGDDVLVVDQVNGTFTDEAVTLRGGPGADTLVGGSGVDVLEGDAGDDVIDGNQASDVLRGGADDDELSWSPGEGNDDVDAGTGTDRLVFVGSNGAETFDLSNVGGVARLTRNIGLVTLDLTQVEALELQALGGTDLLAVGGLTGTGLLDVVADLRIAAGDDVAIDEVRVPATSTVGRDAATAVVTGIGAEVRVDGAGAGDRLVAVGTVGADLLHVVGTSGPDAVTASVSGADLALGGVVPGLAFTATATEAIDIDLGDGDDQFTNSGSLAGLATFAIHGGDGRDTIAGTNGADVIDGGPDADALDGNQGNDTILGGDGSDVVTWDPGDGNDSVTGGAGSDRLVFNGSSALEAVAVARSGSQALLTRDVGLISLVLDSVESVRTNLLAGADTLTVSDLAGSGIISLEVDLAGPAATPDPAADLVTVDATTGDDTVQVVGVGSAVEVSGLAALVRVTGADATLDDLVVNGLAGNDVLTATPGAMALLGVSLVP